MDLQDYVFPIQSKDYVDCGFLIGEYFITSGHVIEKSENPFITIEGKKMQLSDPLFFEANPNVPTRYDLAIFSIPTHKNTKLEYLSHPSCNGKTEFETMIGEYMKR